MYEVKDKVLLITGAAAGIGAGVVRAFLDSEAKHVAVLDVDVKNGKALEEELANKYGSSKVKFHKCDVTSKDLDDCYDDVIKDFGYIDVVINCAGILNDSPQVMEKAVAVNVTALMRSSLRAYNLMRKDHGGKGGTIINIASIVALGHVFHFPVYTATKSAVLQFSACLGSKFHYSRSGVRVVTLCFGCTETTLFSRGKMQAFDKETDDTLETGLGRYVWQSTESAVKGLMEAYKLGASASTWLVTSDKPAKDITQNVSKGYEIMGTGAFEFVS